MSYNPPTTLETPTNQGMSNDNTVFKSNPIMTTCPSCKTTASTTATRQANVLNLLCCLFTTPVSWAIFQVIRGKDFNCCDATHTCSGCGSLIANYSSC